MKNFQITSEHPEEKGKCGDYLGVTYYCGIDEYCSLIDYCLVSNKEVKGRQQTKYQYKAYEDKKYECEKKFKVCFSTKI